MINKGQIFRLPNGSIFKILDTRDKNEGVIVCPPFNSKEVLVSQNYGHSWWSREEFIEDTIRVNDWVDISKESNFNKLYNRLK